MDFLLCLKGTGLPLKGIRQIMELYSRGDETIPERIRLLKEHKAQTLDKLSELKTMLEKIDGKICWYEGMLSGKKNPSPVQKPINRVQSA
jgi:DNA-binding transcriptional MerR regulator